MSLFSIGGNLGYSLGVIVTTADRRRSRRASGAASLSAVPTIMVAAMLLSLIPSSSRSPPLRGKQSSRAPGEDRLGAMALLLGIVTVRSVAWFGLITFVPLWEVSIGNSEGLRQPLLSFMLLSGALGTLIAGPAADRFGRRPVLLVSSLIVPPAIAVFLLRRRRRRRDLARRRSGRQSSARSA